MKTKNEEINLDGGYGLGEKNYSLIKNALSNKDITNILEFGSGASTVRLSIDYPNSKIDSIDQSEEYRQQTVELLEKYRVKNANVHCCPLKLQAVDALRLYLTYDLANIKFKEYDFVLIDGPVERQTVRGREGVLYMIFPFIKEQGVIVLDDYHRASSKKTVVNWINTYPEQLKIIKEYKHIIILQKYSGKNSYKYNTKSIIDNWKSFLVMLRRNYRNLL